MPISSSLAARLGPASAPAPTRWSPYARPSEPRGDGGAKACRSPLRFDPTAMLLGSAPKVAASRSNCRAEAAASDVAAPIQRRRGDEKPKPKPAERDEEPPVEECRGGGGFTFLCVLVGHTEAICGISLPLGSDKLYSGSADGCVRVWDCNSGKCVDVIKMGGKVGCMITHGPWVFVGIPKSVEVWDLKTLQCVQTLSEHKVAVTSVLCWDQKLLSCSLDKTVKVWVASKSGNLQVMYTHAEEHVVAISVCSAHMFSLKSVRVREYCRIKKTRLMEVYQ